MFSTVESHMPLAQFPLHSLQLLESGLLGGGRGQTRRHLHPLACILSNSTFNTALGLDDKRG